MVSLNLEVAKFCGKHSGNRISEMLDRVLMKWNLNKEYLSFMIRDNASNGALACRQSSIPSFGCIPHSMHLVLSPLLFPVLEKLMALRPKDTRHVKPIVDVVTRWSSTCMMLERLVSLKSAIDAFILYVYSPSGIKKMKPKVDDWLIVECLLNLSRLQQLC